MEPAAAVATSLGVILGRGFSKDLYGALTADISEGLTEATYPVLSAIEHAGEPVSAATLAPTLGFDRSVVSRRAATLISARLVANVIGAEDRRQALLTLTPAGIDAIQTTRRRLEAAIHRNLVDWPDSDQRAFAVLLERFTASPLSSQ